MSEDKEKKEIKVQCTAPYTHCSYYLGRRERLYGDCGLPIDGTIGGYKCNWQKEKEQT